MANDPGLSGDSCLFMEAISGDGGVHRVIGPWWLSPDVELTGPQSGPDVADGGQVNPVTVTFHRKPDASGCHFPGDESLNVELWIAGPSLVMAPRVRGSASRVGFIGSPVPPAGGTGTQPFDFTPTAGLPAGDPLSPGPKCLVARSYPSSLIPSSSSFFVPGDPHVAQHNVVVVRCTAGASPPRSLCTLKVATLNPAPPPSPPNPLRKSPVKLRAVQDLRPTRFVRSTMLKRLQLVAGFQRVRTSPLPGGFRFDLSGLSASNVVDHSHSSGPSFPPPPKPPSFEVRIELAPRLVVQIPFQADLSGAQVGDACLFHLAQFSVADVIEGGLTLAMVRL